MLLIQMHKPKFIKLKSHHYTKFGNNLHLLAVFSLIRVKNISALKQFHTLIKKNITF
jgi:hypothetical protein